MTDTIEIFSMAYTYNDGVDTFLVLSNPTQNTPDGSVLAGDYSFNSEVYVNVVGGMLSMDIDIITQIPNIETVNEYTRLDKDNKYWIKCDNYGSLMESDNYAYGLGSKYELARGNVGYLRLHKLDNGWLFSCNLCACLIDISDKKYVMDLLTKIIQKYDKGNIIEAIKRNPYIKLIDNIQDNINNFNKGINL